MGNIATNLETIRRTLPSSVELVAVSKFHPAEAIAEAYDAGQRVFGESRAQELSAKAQNLPSDIKWHFIGHLQTNKVRPVVTHASLIESIDSQRLLDAVDREALHQGKVARVLMQVHVAREETKFGFSPEELLEFFKSRKFEQLKATHICGLMAMASNTDNTGRIEKDFETVAALRKQILEIASDLRGFDILSMGMSHDYPLAIAHGATHVRVGTAIFGDRTY
ncbi:MAG: YggS family pyridoxal phosphate-dependent enzyme [Firmicutes bacterium]|nr:YggS family pyridoxal phosphate-dependent enzyme [Bacillota bacterium]MCM1400968.1 YggS family pyridoxal phosphate-dependent enzyme [Bacteroides sp.]MCM1476492.1 YggS family pyridoxal phosphate-dependent enzyme [Bacteroides sp.]